MPAATTAIVTMPTPTPQNHGVFAALRSTCDGSLGVRFCAGLDVTTRALIWRVHYLARPGAAIELVLHFRRRISRSCFVGGLRSGLPSQDDDDRSFLARALGDTLTWCNTLP